MFKKVINLNKYKELLINDISELQFGSKNEFLFV